MRGVFSLCLVVEEEEEMLNKHNGVSLVAKVIIH